MSGKTSFVENVYTLIKLIFKLSKIKNLKLREVRKFKLV